MSPIVLAAAALGLFGSVHCVAMCGGIVLTLSAGIRPDLRKRPAPQLGFVLAYNVGRLFSYAILGAAVGATSRGLGEVVHGAQASLRVAAGVFTVGLGLHFTGLLPGFARIERLAAPAFERIAPYAKRLLPVRTLPQALALGALWGWVPCSMVYTALALAAASSDASQGAASMIAFGAGTLPAMLLTGTVAGHLLAAAGRAWVRGCAGVVLAALGVVTLATTLPSLGGSAASHSVCHGSSLSTGTILSSPAGESGDR